MRQKGYSFSRGALYVVLSNPLYVGEIRHRGVRHPGNISPSLTGSYGTMFGSRSMNIRDDAGCEP